MTESIQAECKLGAAVLRLMGEGSSFMVSRDETRFAVTVMLAGGGRRYGKGPSLLRAVLEACGVREERYCSGCEKFHPVMRFSPGDRYCRECRKRLARERRAQKRHQQPGDGSA